MQGKAGTRAVINLLAQPRNSLTGHMKVGQTMHWTRIGAGVTSADGSYSLSVSRAALLLYGNPDETVNLQAIAVAGHKFSAYGIVVRLNSKVHALTTHSMHLWKAASRAGFPAVARYLAHRSVGTIVPAVCASPKIITTYTQQWGKIGQTSITITITGGETRQFTFSKRQSSSLGEAWAVDGYSESGTVSKSSNETIPFAKYGDNITYTYETQWQYALYSDGGCGNMTQPYQYWGGGQVIQVSPVSAPYCASYAAGSSPQWKTSTAAHFNLGIPVPKLSITLTAQTGWDRSAMITYGKGPSKHNVCGHDGPPGTNPGWVVVK